MIKISQLINDNNNPAANQFVIEVDNGYVFQSYNTIIAFYDADKRKVYMSKDWEYSNTTRKHFYIFLRDYCGACGEIRKCDVLYEIEQGNYILFDNLSLAGTPFVNFNVK